MTGRPRKGPVRRGDPDIPNGRLEEAGSARRGRTKAQRALRIGGRDNTRRVRERQTGRARVGTTANGLRLADTTGGQGSRQAMAAVRSRQGAGRLQRAVVRPQQAAVHRQAIVRNLAATVRPREALVVRAAAAIRAAAVIRAAVARGRRRHRRMAAPRQRDLATTDADRREERVLHAATGIRETVLPALRRALKRPLTLRAVDRQAGRASNADAAGTGAATTVQVRVTDARIAANYSRRAPAHRGAQWS